ncbi:MAG: glutamine amidotransferase [bacterium]
MQISFSFQWWLALVFFIPAIGIITFFYFRIDKPLRGYTRFILITLRSIAIGLMLFCLLEPIIIAQQEIQKKGNLLILVDDSQSMSIKDQAGDTRIESIKKILNNETVSNKNNISELSKRFNVRLYKFTSSATNVEKFSLNADGSFTDIGNSLTKAIREWRGQPIAGVMLITDGANNAGVDPVTIAQQSGIPIYTVGVGSTTSSKDIQINRVEANPIAYVDHVLPIKVSIKSKGYDGKEIRVSLIQENILKDIVSLKLDSKEVEQIVNLQFKPQQEGTINMKVSVPSEPDEYNKQNNSFPFLVKVIRTKLKVLYIEGRPRWEYTFLKRALQRDPNIETTFMIANKQPNTFYPISDRRALPEKLAPYDVIILGDISPAFFTREQENAIKAYIENYGGSLLLLAGEDSLGKGGFSESSLKDLLPIEEPRLIKGTFNPILTQYGQIHPATRLSDDQIENNAIWRDLPAIYQFYASTKVKSGSIVLLESQQESGKPLIVFQRYGKGIVMMFTTDNTWQWAFSGYSFGIDDSHYRKLWSSIIRWLASIRNQADKITVETDKQSYYKYEKVRITAYIYNENYEPVNDAQIKAQIQSDTKNIYDVTFVSEGDGRYIAEFKPVLDGNYKVNIEAQRKEISLGKGSTEFIVQSIALEMQDTQLNERLLKELALVSGGAYCHIDDIDQLNIKEVNETITSTFENSIWDNIYVFIAAIIFLGAEWLLRKRNGLI